MAVHPLESSNAGRVALPVLSKPRPARTRAGTGPLWGIVVAVAAGCGTDAESRAVPGSAEPGPSGAGNGSPASGPGRAVEAGPTATGGGVAASPSFWQDVAPLFNEKCVHCHQAGGLAPFRLDDYAAARVRANQIAALTAARIMPPFLAETGGSCGSFDESAALSAAQIDLIGDWVNGGAPEGSPVELSLPALPSLPDAREWRTPDFTPAIQGGTLAEFDEYRCFRVDLGLESDSWVTGWEVLPGNPQMVHHVIAFILDPEAPAAGGTNAEVMQQLDDETPDRLGWPCFGGAGDRVNVESAPVEWAPGAGAVTFPGGVGIRVRQNRQMVVQVHYNLAKAEVRGQRDQTRIKLQLADQVERQAFFLLEDEFLATIYTERPARLEPGQAAVPFTWTKSVSDMLGGVPLPVSLDLVAVSAHMHERGRKWTLEAGNDGQFECIGRINRWDSNWQLLYRYTAPPELRTSSELRLTCEYDTRADTEPVQPGWGTRNEMCLASLMLALPPGLTF